MLQIAENEALQDGIHFVRAVAQQSGVFIRHGKTYDFIHPTFREYFAACALSAAMSSSVRMVITNIWCDR